MLTRAESNPSLDYNDNREQQERKATKTKNDASMMDAAQEIYPLPPPMMPPMAISRAISAPDFRDGIAHELYPPPITPPFSGVHYEMDGGIHLLPPLPSVENTNTGPHQKLQPLPAFFPNPSTKTTDIVNIPSKVETKLSIKNVNDIVNEQHLFSPVFTNNAISPPTPLANSSLARFLGPLPLTYSKTTPLSLSEPEPEYNVVSVAPQYSYGYPPAAVYPNYDAYGAPAEHYHVNHQNYENQNIVSMNMNMNSRDRELELVQAGLESIPDIDPAKMPPTPSIPSVHSHHSRGAPPTSRSYQYRNYRPVNDGTSPPIQVSGSSVHGYEQQPQQPQAQQPAYYYGYQHSNNDGRPYAYYAAQAPYYGYPSPPSLAAAPVTAGPSASTNTNNNNVTQNKSNSATTDDDNNNSMKHQSFEQREQIAESFRELDLIDRVQAMKAEKKRLEQSLNAMHKKNVAKQMQNQSLIKADKSMHEQFEREKRALLNMFQKKKQQKQQQQQRQMKNNKNKKANTATTTTTTTSKDFYTVQIERLKKEKKTVLNKNFAAEIAADVVSNCIQKQIEDSNEKLVKIKSHRRDQREINRRLELEVLNLRESVSKMKTSLEEQKKFNRKKVQLQKKKREMVSTKEEVIEKMMAKNNNNNNNSNKTGTAAVEIEEEKAVVVEKELVGEMIHAGTEEYPTDAVILQRLIRAQAEFYFSDYNLKRDKRLLEKIKQKPMHGYLSMEDVLGLSRVRQLCNSTKYLYEALKYSPYIQVVTDQFFTKNDPLNNKLFCHQKNMRTKKANEEKSGSGSKGTAAAKKNIIPFSELPPHLLEEISFAGYVGRKDFTAPAEKPFPFRRTVFIYGLPWYADKKYIFALCNPFGGVTKVQFDYGPDTMDRQIMRKMLQIKPRVYKLLSRDSAAVALTFSGIYHKQSDTYTCRWCKKHKDCVDGYYHPARKHGSGAPEYMVCLQCAAARAEAQATKYEGRSKLVQDDKRLKELLLGLAPRSVSSTKTALCVFSSQRQASKCVYVRSRLAFDGAFATHYHHYSKLKKDIVLDVRPKSRQLKKHANNEEAANSAERLVVDDEKEMSSGLAAVIQKQQRKKLMGPSLTAPVYLSSTTQDLPAQKSGMRTNDNDVERMAKGTVVHETPNESMIEEDPKVIHTQP